MAGVSPGARAAAQWVRANPGQAQARCVRAIQGSSAYATAWGKVKEARDAGLIMARKSGTRIYLYPC
jgi:hypothetical protein